MHARVLREQQNLDDDDDVASSLSLYVLFSIHHTTNRLSRLRQRQLFILLYIAFTRTTVHLIVSNNNNSMSLAVPLPSSSSSSTCSPSWEALVSTLKSKGILKSPSNDSPSPCETVADLMTKSGAQQQQQEEGNVDNQQQHQQQQPLLLVLVGGSWCAPCRNFTPVLKDCTSSNNNNDNAKVLFCSADHDDDSFWSYFGQMPASWSAVPYDQDEEDERDDLLEALHANSLPTLLVLDPLTGTVLEKNAVHAVQASGSGDGFAALIDKWRNMAQSGEAAAAAVVAATTTNNNSSSSTTATAGEETKEDNDKTTLKYFIPAPPLLICQYFKERLISPDLPEALKSVILRRHVVVAQEDEAAKKLADAILGDADNDERWLFRTAAPALPMNWYGSSVLGNIEANAIECWSVERDDDAADHNNNIRKATCIIENETGRMILVFRETIVMEATEDGHGTNVTKTLNLNGVPSMGHGPFQRRWKAESELIFHALLGSCDRKKSKA
jgi:thiol-disulfide isomerase/thioredoxin